MSDSSDSPRLLDIIAEDDDNASVVTGAVLSYAYLDAQGVPSYGVRILGDDRYLTYLGLTEVARQEVIAAGSEWSDPEDV